jgi:CDP-diacylglycerol--glycerol-3-phosphate 3-phosphatidyltransferase
MAPSRLNLPNVISVARIAATPAVFFLALSPEPRRGYWAFVLFLLAALSDLWDGYLARKYGWITDLGKLLDPLADKLLLVSTFIPFYMISHRGPEWELPYWGALPMWVMVVVFGRELFITLFRSWASRRDVVIAAGQSGKYKAFIQNLFSGGALLWFPLVATARSSGWTGTGTWTVWSALHGAWIGITLTVAVFLTVYSLGDYLWNYRSLIRDRF